MGADQGHLRLDASQFAWFDKNAPNSYIYDCRDLFLLAGGQDTLMYYTARAGDDEPCIAVARSRDMEFGAMDLDADTVVEFRKPYFGKIAANQFTVRRSSRRIGVPGPFHLRVLREWC